MSTMISVLHSPTKTFEYIRERGGSFTIPLITIMVISLIAIFLQLPMIEKTIEAKTIDLGDSTMNLDTVKKVGTYSAIVMAPIIVAASTFIYGLLLLLLNLVVRGEATYMQLVKVSLFSLIPSLISSLLTGILVRTSDVDSPKDVLFSLGAFFQDKEGFVFGLANIINPFTLWSLAILIIGAAVMCQRPIKSVGMWIGGIWIVIQLITAMFA